LLLFNPLQIRRVETNADNYRLCVASYLAKIDRMNLDIREYLTVLPVELGSPVVT